MLVREPHFRRPAWSQWTLPLASKGRLRVQRVEARTTVSTTTKQAPSQTTSSAPVSPQARVVALSVPEAQGARRDTSVGALGPGATWAGLGAEDRTIAAIVAVYGVQGIIELATPAITYFFKDELQLDPGQAAAWLTIINLPWCIKPAIGFVSDTVPLWGYRRRSYLLLASVAAAGSWALMAGAVHTTEAAVAALFVGALAIACSDVIADSMVVERARSETEASAGTLQSLCWAAYSIGTLATAYLSGRLIQDHGTRFVFALTAAFPLLVGVAALVVPEQKIEKPAAVPTLSIGSITGAGIDGSSTSPAAGGLGSLSVLWETMRRPDVLAPLAFLMLLSSTPSPDTAMFFYQTEVLNMTPEFLGQVQMAAALASLAGVGLYQLALKEVPLRALLLYGTLLSAALSTTQLVLVTGAHRPLGWCSDELLVLGGAVGINVIQNVLGMPTMVLAARLCPPGMEATMFAAIMAGLNMADGIRYAGGAALTALLNIGGDAAASAAAAAHTLPEGWHDLPLLLGICNVALLLPLPLLGHVPSTLDKEGPPAAPTPAAGAAPAEGAFGGAASAAMPALMAGLAPVATAGVGPGSAVPECVPGEPCPFIDVASPTSRQHHHRSLPPPPMSPTHAAATPAPSEPSSPWLAPALPAITLATATPLPPSEQPSQAQAGSPSGISSPGNSLLFHPLALSLARSGSGSLSGPLPTHVALMPGLHGPGRMGGRRQLSPAPARAPDDSGEDRHTRGFGAPAAHRQGQGPSPAPQHHNLIDGILGGGDSSGPEGQPQLDLTAQSQGQGQGPAAGGPPRAPSPTTPPRVQRQQLPQGAHASPGPHHHHHHPRVQQQRKRSSGKKRGH